MDKNQLKQAILSIYTQLNNVSLDKLIESTDEIGGVSFVNIKKYQSDISNNVEVADQLINVGASYKNMLDKDLDIYANFDVNSVDVNKFDYRYINTDKLTLDEYKNEVKNCLPIALEQLQQGKTRKNDMSADIWLNRVLCFNLNTMRMSIKGQSINKTIEVKGDFKVVKSKPLTIAKKLIEKQAKGKTQSLRRFALDNLIGSIVVNKNELIIE
jgi:hypothetical protein